MVVAVAAGRRIYTNLKKAVQYIVSIHIPIIPRFLYPYFWLIYPDIFTPVHVIFPEHYGPYVFNRICMNLPKKQYATNASSIRQHILSLKGISIIQGIVITIGILLVYQLTVQNGGGEN
jgi:Ca2+-transporting ATPase